MVTLTNVGTTYDAIAASKALGVALYDFTGVTQVVFLVRYNKIGTGTLSWQLWNETNGTEIGVVTDAVAGDNKRQEATFNVALTGVKEIRIRAKSTVANDDPVFYAGAVLLVPP